MSEPIYVPADWLPGPGDLAYVTHTDGREELRGNSDLSGKWWYSLAGDSNAWRESDVTLVVRAQVTDPRTHVVIDPNSPETSAVWGHAAANLSSFRDYLRSMLVTVPEPPLPEPNGLGAVVENKVSANLFVRTVGTRPWCDHRYGVGYEWSGLGDVRVLSHGHGCTCGGPGCPGGAT